MINVDAFNWNLARIFYGISIIWAIIGVCCNSLLFITTIKTKTLRSTCNILIAVCAVGDIFHQLGTLSQLHLLFGYYVEIDSDLCLVLMFLPEMGIAIGIICILSVGLDRMFSIIFSIRYRMLNKNKYRLVFACLMVLYCLYYCIIVFNFYEHSSHVHCAILTPYTASGVVWAVGANFLLNAVSTIVYFITWISLRKHEDSTLMKTIMRSLFIIVVVDVSGWTLTSVITVILQLNLDANNLFPWIYFTSNFINAALSVKIFIYYFTSTEYRSAIRAFLLKSVSKKSRVESISSTIK